MSAVSPTASFAVADYVVLGASFGISAMIGVYFVVTERADDSRANYFLGNRKMGLAPVSLSYLATGVTAVGFIGIPAEAYFFGPNLLLMIPGQILALFLVARAVVPIYYRLQVTSIYEYLEMRFDKVVKITAMVMFFLFAVCYMGFVVYAPALALSHITGMSEVTAILIVTIVCSFYTTIGGMKAVVWTDVFQAFLMITGLVSIVVGGLIEVGGFQEMTKRVADGGRTVYLDFRPDITVRYTVYSLTCNGFFVAFSFITTGQPVVQRCLSCRSLRQAQAVIVIGFLLASVVMSLAVWSGLLAYAYYAGCDPLGSGRIQRYDQIVPVIVGDLFSRVPGVAGLIVSGAFSAALSTISSNLNSMSAMVEAAVLSRVFEDSSDRRLTFWSKIVTLVFGVICTVVALLATMLSGVLEETIAFSSVMIGPLSAVFFLGFFVPRCNSKGALSGLLAGVILGVWIKLGSELYPLPGPRPVLSVDGCPWLEGSLNATSHTSVTERYYSGSTVASSTGYQAKFVPGDTSQEPSGLVTFYNMSVYFYSFFTFTATVLVAVLVSLALRSEAFDDPRLQMTAMEVFDCRRRSRREERYAEVDVKEEEEVDTEDAKRESINMSERGN